MVFFNEQVPDLDKFLRCYNGFRQHSLRGRQCGLVQLFAAEHCLIHWQHLPSTQTAHGYSMCGSNTSGWRYHTPEMHVRSTGRCNCIFPCWPAAPGACATKPTDRHPNKTCGACPFGRCAARNRTQDTRPPPDPVQLQLVHPPGCCAGSIS